MTLNKSILFTFRIEHMIHGIMLSLLLLTPIFSIQESLALIFGGIVNNSTALTPVYIKIIKDLGFVLMILIGFVGILKLRSISKVGFLSLLYIILILSTAFLYKNNLLLFLAGIRWLMPIVLMIFIIPYINQNLLSRIAKILVFLFIFHFIFQIIQLFFAGGWFGLNALGLSARNPGMFFIPSTSAFFTILVLFFTMFYLQNSSLRKFVFIFSPISLLLTASGSGVAVYIVIMSLYLLKLKYFKLLPLLSLVLFLIIIYTIEDITGRVGLLEESFGVRIKIFFDVINDSKIFSQSLGFGTSTGYLIANEYGLDFNMTSTDSTYSSIIVNLGLVSFFIVILILLLSLIIAWLNNNKEILIFIMIYGLFSATTSILEAYPMNLLFAILMAYYLRNYKKEKHETPNNPQ